MPTWINDTNACLSFCLCVYPPGHLRLNKQLWLWSMEEPPGVLCLVVHFSKRTRPVSPCAPYLLPAPCDSWAFRCCCSPSLLGLSVWCNTQGAYTQTQRNATPCDLSPTTTRGTALDEGAEGGKCSHVPAPGRRKHSNWSPSWTKKARGGLYQQKYTEKYTCLLLFEHFRLQIRLGLLSGKAVVEDFLI